MLKHRIVTALALLLISLWALFGADTYAWYAVMTLLSAIAAWEWTQFARVKSKLARVSYVLFILLVILASLSFDYAQGLIYLVVLQTAIVIWAVWHYQSTQGRAVLNHMALNLPMGALLIVAFALSTISLRDQFSPWILLVSLLMIWAMDTGAYFSGKRFGRHKLASHVSPGKTWEGLVGGAILVMLLAAFVAYFAGEFLQVPGLVMFVVACVVISLVSVFGDLFESLMKRQVNLKDSGSILPGHGGVLDRIDSLLVAMPLFWLFWVLA